MNEPEIVKAGRNLYTNINGLPIITTTPLNGYEVSKMDNDIHDNLDTYKLYGKECRHRYLKTFGMSKIEFKKKNSVSRSWFIYGKPGSRKNILKRIQLMLEDVKYLHRWFEADEYRIFSNWCDCIYISACNVKKRTLKRYERGVLKVVNRSKEINGNRPLCKNCKYFLDRSHLSRMEQMVTVGAFGTRGYIGCCEHRVKDIDNGTTMPAHICLVEDECHSCFEKK